MHHNIITFLGVNKKVTITFNLNFYLFSGRADVSFTGYDLIPQNIETAKEKFQNESWTFKVFDIVERRIERSFDLIINRHTAIHLGLSDNIKVEKNKYTIRSIVCEASCHPVTLSPGVVLKNLS